MKRFLFNILTVIIFCSSIQAQEVFDWYQDGIVVFQLNPSSKVIIPTEDQMANVRDVNFLRGLQNEYGIYQVFQFFPDYQDEKLRNTFQIKFSELDKVEELIKEFDRYDFIAYAEKKELHKKFLTPNDLGANSTTGTGMWHLYTMQAQQAWDLSTGSSNIIVAITDDAIKIDHPDLINKVIAGNDATDQNSTDPSPCGGNDGNHGTHVTGTVGAETNNGLGVASIGYGVSIMPVKIGRCSDGALTGGYEGLAWAANNGADVINMSWGGGGSSTFAQNVIDNATAQGAILVAAAGNDGTNQLFYPAAYNNVISVASTTNTDAKSGFSQYGTWIDIAAPGSAIQSTWADNGYERIQGTSMASPNVSGLLGLMKSYAPNATNADLIQCMYSSADPVTTFVTEMGAGRINAFAALQCAGTFAFATDVGIAEVTSPASNICGSDFAPQIRLRNFGSNTITSVPITWEWNGTPNNFTWTGNLTTGQTEIITLPLQSAVGGNYTFTASTNLSGDQNNSNNGSSEGFTIDPTGQEIDLTIVTDCYGSEITWNVVDDLGATVLSGGPFGNVTGGETLVNTYCLPVGCYTFTIEDSYGDGMFGSQWNGCTINGDYSATTTTGIPLFQMTAANADFGTAASHDFCLTAVGVLNDAGITQIQNPSGTICDDQIIPQVSIQNYGSNALTSTTINYSAGAGNQTFNWTGNLSTGQNEIVTLPVITAATGNIVFEAFTSAPNATTDDNISNDSDQVNISVFTNGIALPFTESFESNSFNTNLWTLNNPDNDITWDLVTTAGNTPGSTAARMNFYNYTQTSQRDGLISPLFNLNGYSSVTMDFEHAYRRFVVQGSNQPAPTDSLIIAISTDCGGNWQRVLELGEDGTGSMATNVTSNQAFTPQTAEDWCLQQVLVGGNLVGANCFSVNLDAFIGEQIFVRFEGFNAGTQGNNLFIDNINIYGVPVASLYDAGITSILNPSSVCGATLSPEIEITNFGSSILTTATVSYQWNGGAVQTFNWTGNLGTGQTENITLPAQILQTGNNIFSANTDLPNGQTDANPSNDGQSSTIIGSTLADPTVSIPAQICEATNEVLMATAVSNGNIVWYDDLLAVTPISSSPDLTVNLTANNYTYYVQELIDTTTLNVGLTNYFTGAFFQNTDRFLYFDVLDDVVLKSVEVNADAAGNRNIQLRDDNGTVLQQVIVNIPAGISRVNLDFEIAPGTDYQLGLGAGLNGLWRTNDPANILYPYTINGLISIVESDVGVDFVPPDPNTYYYSFYDWEVARPYCESSRVAVDFLVENCNVAPVADFSANTTSICIGESVNFSDLSTEAPTSWSWNFVGGTPATSTLQNPTVSYNAAGTFEVSLTANNSSGSDTETKSAYILVYDAPTVTISGNNSFCSGGNSILTANTSGASVSSYNWEFNGNPIGGNSATLNATQGGNYSISTVDVNGCVSQIASFTLTESVNPSVSISGNTSFCAGDSSVLSANTGGSNIVSYQWRLNSSNVGSSMNTYVALQGGTYSLEVTDINGCIGNSLTYIVTENSAPVVVISGNNSICGGASTLLTANVSSGSVATYQWTRNGSNVGTNMNTFSASLVGDYVLTATDNNGCSSSSPIFTVTQNSGAAVSISGNNNFCSGSNVMLTANTTGANIFSYQWRLNGANVGLSNSNYAATQGGSYTVEVADVNGCVTNSLAFIVQENTNPTVSISGNTSFCSGTSAVLTANVSGGSITTYQWTRNGVPIGGNTASIAASQTGNYTVSITNNLGCSGTSFGYIVTENLNPTVTISGNSDLCPSSSTLLNANVVGPNVSSYQWSLNSSNIGMNNSTFNASLTGTYVVSVTDVNGCSGISASFDVNLAPALNIQIATTETACDQNSGSAAATVNGTSIGYTFIWSSSPGQSGAAVANLPAGNYSVTAIDNATGCQGVQNYVIGTANSPSIDNLVLTQPDCLDTLGSATATVSGGSGNYTYDWGVMGMNSSSVTGLLPGNYDLVVTDDQGCSTQQSFAMNAVNTISISANTIVDASCSEVENGSIDVIILGGDGNYSISWDNGANTEDIDSLEPGSYTIDVNDNSGCTASATYVVGFVGSLDVDLTVTNGFSNAGDASIAATVIGGTAPYTYSWNNGTLTGQEIIDLSAGEYFLVVVDANGCTALSDTVTIGTVSIQDLEFSRNFQLLPNPTNGMLSIRGEGISGNLIEVEVVNILGQIIETKLINHQGNVDARLNLDVFEAGVYQIVIRSENKQSVWPIIKVD